MFLTIPGKWDWSYRTKTFLRPSLSIEGLHWRTGCCKVWVSASGAPPCQEMLKQKLQRRSRQMKISWTSSSTRVVGYTVYGIPCIETRLFHMVINHFLIGMQRQVWFQSICSFPYFHIFPVGVYLFWRFQKCTCPVFVSKNHAQKKKASRLATPHGKPLKIHHPALESSRDHHLWSLMKPHEISWNRDFFNHHI